MHNRIICLLCIFILIYVKSSMGLSGEQEDCPNRNDFRCKNGDCIDFKKECNGVADCTDESDELDCFQNRKNDCEKDEYRCKNGKCILESFKCDGHNDCDGNDDEENCPNPIEKHETIECTKEEFTCIEDNMCLALEYVCDGIKQCMDGSDETMGCLDVTKSCKDGFLCKNNRCLTDKEWVCDGFNDCGDNSDEEQHCLSNCLLEDHKYLCKDNETCIDVNKLCDEESHCQDDSDEGNFCKRLDRIKDCENHCPASVECVILPTGPACICPKGFKYNDLTSLCEDINECEQYGICSQGCFNKNGSYECVCVSKFRLAADNRTCVVVNSHEEPMLLFTTQHTVSGIDLESQRQYVITKSSGQIIGVSFDGHMIYWTDIALHTEKIVRVRKNGKDVETLLSSGLMKPEDLAIDHYTGNIYISDSEYNHIAVCTNNGEYCKILLNEDIHLPRSIVLYPQKARMYWSEWGENPSIAVAYMDGTSAKTLISDRLGWVNGLALDWPNERLYWVDARHRVIETSRLDGTDRRKILSNLSKNPYSIAVFQNSIYWSDKKSKGIEYCDKFTGKNRKILIKDRSVFDIHIFHSALQNFGANPCNEHPCSHICLLSANNSFTCECPENMELNVDKSSCKKASKELALIVGIGDKLLIYHHNEFGKTRTGTQVNLDVYASQIEFNSITGDVFICDNKEGIIYNFDLNGLLKYNTLVDSIGHVSALAFDHLGNNLYWSDTSRNTIEVLDLNSNYRAVVASFSGGQSPIALTVLPEKGKLFCVLRSMSGSHMDSLDMDGRGAHYHLIEDGIGNGYIHMTIDRELEEVFWSDYDLNKISFTDYDGASHHTFLSSIKKPVSISAVGDYIFWTTSNTRRLYYTTSGSLSETKKFLFGPDKNAEVVEQIHLVKKSLLTVSNHPCMRNNAGCSHICVAMSPTLASCLCPLGMSFVDFRQNNTCTENKQCEFRCRSGECIKSSMKCNGVKDCIDNSDEDQCSKGSMHVKNCLNVEFSCADASECVPSWKRCDGHFDCKDKSDEEKCPKQNMTSTSCHELQYMCSDGSCIDVNGFCDGVSDCTDGSDENNDHCDPETKACGDNMFECSSGQCILEKWVCDDKVDCVDHSDENNCDTKECPENFKRCNHGHCIEGSLWCDGKNDCGDFSDEDDCPTRKGATASDSECESDDQTFQCMSDKTICLQHEARCNGSAECPRGEDEVGCDGCSIREFMCTNGDCIRTEFRCDTQIDCADGSDENNCNVTIHNNRVLSKCSDDLFDCKDGTCLNWSEVCDNNKDCADGSDENGQCQTSCSAGHPCDQKCRKSPYGAVCGCRDGYRLSNDKANCEDVDECATSDNPCSQICENHIGSYSCSCYAGFMLHLDKSYCKSIDSPKYFIYSSENTIWKLNPHLSVLWAEDSRIVSVDMNIQTQMLYFTVEETDSLYEFNLTDKSLLAIHNIGNPTLISLDWITGNIYYIDKSIESKIRVCRMQDRVCITIFKLKKQDVIKSLAVDPINRLIFYAILRRSAFNRLESQIYSANLDGINPTLLAETKTHVSALACDYNRNILYYVDWDTTAIWSMNYDGSSQMKVVKHEQITHPVGIDLFEGSATIINRGSNAVVTCKLYGDKTCVQFRLNVDSVDNFLTVQESRQRIAHNTCENYNCSGICMARARWSDCVCDYGYLVEPDTICETDSNSSPRLRLLSKDGSGTFGGIFGSIIIILALLLSISGAIYLYKLRNSKNFNVSLHFQNPKNTFDAAKVKLSQFPQYVRNMRRGEIFMTMHSTHLPHAAQSTPKSCDEHDLDLSQSSPDHEDHDWYNDDSTRRLIP